MYHTPRLQRLGAMRDVTQGGGARLIDPFGPNADGSGCRVTEVGPPEVIECVGPVPAVS
jgi:hypothetical protein